MLTLPLTPRPRSRESKRVAARLAGYKSSDNTLGAIGEQENLRSKPCRGLMLHAIASRTENQNDVNEEE